MSVELSLEEKNIAVGHDREAALKVIQPRLFYAIQSGNVRVFNSDHLMLRCHNPDFNIQAISGNAKSLSIRVIWNGTLVFTAELWPSRLFPLDGDLRIKTWLRGPKVSQWQAVLFDRYPMDDGYHQRLLGFGDVLAFLRAIQHYEPKGYDGMNSSRP